MYTRAHIYISDPRRRRRKGGEKLKPSHVVASRATTIKCPAARRATTRQRESVRGGGNVSGNNKKNREETGLEKNRQVVATKRNEGRGRVNRREEGGKEGNSHALPSTPSSPRLRRRTRWGRQKEIRGELFFFLASVEWEREREREGEVGRRGWYVRSAVWKSRQEKWVAGKGEEGRGGEWSSEEIKRKKKGGRESRERQRGDDVPSLCNQQPPIVWRPGATIRAHHCLPFRAATAHHQCLTIMHSASPPPDN